MTLVTKHLDRLNNFIDLDRFPIHELNSQAGSTLIEQGHDMMAQDTLCLFEGFLRPQAVCHISDEITALEPASHQVDYPSTLYGWMNNAGFSDNHPRARLLRRRCGVITTDQLHASDPCHELYQFDELTEFVRRLLQLESLYRSQCPTLAIQINVMRTSESFEWHYDTNDGVVSFSIQNAESGGGFEYVPLIRNEDDENYDAVQRILDGIDTPRKPCIQPGCFTLFLGRQSLHRVAPVRSTARSRQSLLLSYHHHPGHVFPPQTCERLTSESNEPYLGAGTPIE